MDNGKCLVELKNISKNFGKIQALKNVTLDINESEVVGLVGDNGAGKSTLMKILSGAYIPDGGEIYIYGEKVRFSHPKDAQERGIGIIYQDLALAHGLGVVDNIFMGKELKKFLVFTDDRKMRKITEETLKKLKTTVKSIDQPISELSGGQQHAVATARLLVGDPPSIVLMDEPTAGLGVVESEKIIDIISEMKERGLTVVLISHNLEHVFRVSDRIVILHSGTIAGELKADKSNKEKYDRKEVVNIMMGIV